MSSENSHLGDRPLSPLAPGRISALASLKRKCLYPNKQEMHTP